MAAKNTEKTPAPVDTSTLNVWAKLLKVRSEFYAEGAKKTGKNLHAEFKYFELEDIVPVAAPLFAKYGLLLIPTFVNGNAVAQIINIDEPDETIEFIIPLQFIAEPGKFRMNEVQGVGAVVTYYRRYLYMVVLDLVESDGIDNQKPKADGDAPATAPAAPKKNGNYVCTIHNTITRPFKVSERYPHFERDYVKPALKWWKEYVETGLSPMYDEKRDAEILKVLRTNNLSPETDLAELVREAEELKAKLDAHAAEVADDEKRYKVVTDLIKQSAIKQFREGDKKVSVTGSRFSWEVSRSSTTKIDKAALKADGLLDKYSTTEDTYRLLPKEIKEES